MVPRTLIQVHYHNAVGGVTKVMGLYARAFAQLNSGKTHRSLVICHDRGSVGGLLAHSETLSDARCDYHEYGSIKSFEHDSALLGRSLIKWITDEDLPGPVAIVGHNLNLGKNCALSSAFARCVRTLAKDPRYRFISLVHDRAEEGRVSQLRQIGVLARLGAGIWSDLYPRSPNLIFGVLNRNAKRDLEGRGLSTRLLFNPVELSPLGSLTKAKSRAIADRLARIASTDGSAFDRKKPTFCCPARITARKNILEAILVGCLAAGHNLLLGGCGASAADRRLYERLKRFCRSNRLPVVFDCARRHDGTGDASPQHLFRTLTLFADAVLSTSILEGFGYSLYEPWLSGRRVFGRRPDGCTPPTGMDFSSLYRACRIPSSLVNRHRLEREYRARLYVKMKIGRDIDFADLDLREQFRVLRAVIRDASLLSTFKVTRLASSKMGESLTDIFQRQPDLNRNRTFVLRHLSFDRFVGQLRLLLQPCREPPRRGRKAETGPGRSSTKSRLLLVD